MKTAFNKSLFVIAGFREISWRDNSSDWNRTHSRGTKSLKALSPNLIDWPVYRKIVWYIVRIAPARLGTELARIRSRRATTPQDFHSENASVVFRPQQAGGIWRRSFLLWKHISCFSSTTGRRNLKTEFFTLKTHQLFFVHNRPEEFEDGVFHSENTWVVFRPHHTKGIQKRNNSRSFWIWHHRFRKAPFSKCFPSTRKRKTGVFKFLRFENLRRFRAEGRPNRRNKAAFPKFYGVMWTLLIPA